ncbi:MAG: hypothetical protein RRY53_02805, partial [Pseudoflavonifractor sp.]
TMEAPGFVTTGTAVIADRTHFLPTNPGYITYLENGNQVKLRMPEQDTYVRSTGNDAAGNGSAAYPYATLALAYEQVKTGGTIHVMDDITVRELVTFGADKAVTISSCKADGSPWAAAGDTHKLLRQTGGSLITITHGSLTLAHITLTDAVHHANSPICVGNGSGSTADLIMNDGATITGTESNHSAVYLFKGNMTMNAGAQITGHVNRGAKSETGIVTGVGGAVTLGHANAGSATGAAVSTATLTMNGGTISGNSAVNGGGVYVVNGSTFTMHGGSILNNTASVYGGGVYVCGTMTMDGGEISGNSATGGVDASGGGVCLAPASTTATATVGGDSVFRNNTAAANGSALHAGGVGSKIILGGNTLITGNTARTSGTTIYGGGAVYTYTGAVEVSGNVRVTGNDNRATTNAGAANKAAGPCNIYLFQDNKERFTITGPLGAAADIRVSGVSGAMDEAGAFGTRTNTACKNLAAVIQDSPTGDRVRMATDGSHDAIPVTGDTDLIWSYCDMEWLDAVADPLNAYGWNDNADTQGGINGGGATGNGNPNGILLNTPSKLYSLAYAIAHNYDPTTKLFDTDAVTAKGADYADGYYYVTANLDMSAFPWISMGTAAIPFTGVVEGGGVRTITGIRYTAALHSGLFGVVGKESNTPHTCKTGASAPLNSRYVGTAIYNLAVDGGGKPWKGNGSVSHLGGIAGMATEATIQNCAVRNIPELSIVNFNGVTYAGGIAGYAKDCTITNNSVGQTGTAMLIYSDTNTNDSSVYAGGIVGCALGTDLAKSVISGNTVGNGSANTVTIEAVPDDGAEHIYAGGIAGYAEVTAIRDEGMGNVNAVNVIAETAGPEQRAYAGGVAGYLKNAVMENCNFGANASEKLSVTAQSYHNASPAGSFYAGGLAGGTEGTATLLTNCSIVSDSTANFKVLARVPGTDKESYA